MRISPGSLACILFYFLHSVKITSMPFQSIIHVLTQGFVHTCTYSTSDFLNSNYPAPIPSPVLPACSLKYIHHTCSSVSKEFLILDPVFPLSVSSWLESHFQLRYQSLSLLAHSLVDSVSILHYPCCAITRQTQT